MKKALLTTLSSNKVMQDDLRALESLLGSGWEVSIMTLGELGKHFDPTVVNGKPRGLVNLPVEEYDFIGFSIPYSAMHVSNGFNVFAIEEIFKRAKEGALTLIAADTTLLMDPFMWSGPTKEDIAEAKASGRPLPKNILSLNSPKKFNPYLARPMRVLGSFSKDIEQDNKAMRRINSIWLNKLHPESEFLPVEWLSGMVNFVPDELRQRMKKAPKTRERIHNFYFGLQKRKVVHSLRKLGFGEHPKDAVFGTMSKSFPAVRDFTEERTGDNRRNRNNPDSWLGLVMKAEHNLLPYDPIKGDYQFTKRFLEIAVPKRESVVADPRLESTGLTRYLDERFWHETANKTSLELNSIY